MKDVQVGKHRFIHVTEAEYFDPANAWLHDTADYDQIKIVDAEGNVTCSISTNAPRDYLDDEYGLVTLTPEETKVFAEKILLHPPKVPEWLKRAVLGDDEV